MHKLAIGEATYLWRVSHPHNRSGIEDLFTAYLDGHPRAPLHVLFVETGGREDLTRSGVVAIYDRAAVTWNLNLPATARALIELAYVGAYSCEEISAIMKCPASAVRTRLLDARFKLRIEIQAGAAGLGADAAVSLMT